MSFIVIIIMNLHLNCSLSSIDANINRIAKGTTVVQYYNELNSNEYRWPGP